MPMISPKKSHFMVLEIVGRDIYTNICIYLSILNVHVYDK
jgi:hypothetical protein